MKIVYFALKNLDIGVRKVAVGDMIPEASVWDRPNLYVEAGKMMPVLVATLPRHLQKELEAWEQEQEMLTAMMQERDPNQPDEAPDEETQEEAEEPVEEEVPSA